MTVKPIALIDVDGVLADFMTAALVVLHELTGQELTVDDFTTWDLFNKIDRKYENDFYEIIGGIGWCKDLEPYPDAVRGVQQLQKVADVFYVTSPVWSSRHWMYERTHWLKEHFGAPSANIIQAGAKHLVHGQLFLDDHPSHVLRWGEKNRGIPVLWDQPYNRSVLIEDFYVRAKSWEDVHNFMLEYIYDTNT